MLHAALWTAGQTQVICFSRHVHTKQMKLGAQNTKGEGCRACKRDSCSKGLPQSSRSSQQGFKACCVQQ
jgi:predicted transcriptional regulator